MKSARMLLLLLPMLPCLAPPAARAERQTIRGRTGLPAVREGAEKVWMERGDVRLSVVGDRLYVSQEFRLRYPGPPLERAGQRITVAVREDYFRARQGDAPEVTSAEAKGFQNFAVFVDGRRFGARIEPWQLNDRKDTATRWRVVSMGFRPGQIRRLRIISRAPLGERDGQPYVQFVSKDLGHWRQPPDLLEIRFSAPRSVETRLSDFEPDTKDVSAGGLRWIYRKEEPDRDILVWLPAGYRARTSRR